LAAGDPPPDLAGGAYCAPTDLLAGLKGKGRGMRKEREEGREKEEGREEG